MIKFGARQNYRLPVCFAGSRPATTLLTLAPPSIAVVSFDHRCATPIPHMSRPTDRARRCISRLPNKHSTHLGNRPPASEIPHSI